MERAHRLTTRLGRPGLGAEPRRLCAPRSVVLCKEDYVYRVRGTLFLCFD